MSDPERRRQELGAEDPSDLAERVLGLERFCRWVLAYEGTPPTGTLRRRAAAALELVPTHHDHEEPTE